MKTILDLLTGELIEFTKGDFVEHCNKLGIEHTSIGRVIRGELKHCNSRYINPSSKTFILVDIDSGKQYRCINNKTIFLHLNIPYNDNEAKYVYELKTGKQQYASIGNRVFRSLDQPNSRRIKTMKNQSTFISSHLDKGKQIANIKRRLLKLINSRTKKSAKTSEYIGCSVDYLKKYIESRFVYGMSWDNYGLWHYDHIVPITHFDLTDKRQQLLAFHYTNLQPIWATTKIANKFGHKEYLGNLNKSDRLPFVDYLLVDVLKNKLLNEDNLDEADAVKAGYEFSRFLWEQGYRKVDL